MKKRLVAWALMLAAAWPAFAQGSYPDRPIRVVVPFGPGSGPDVLTRLIAAKMQAELGQQMPIENRPGAGGAIGTAFGRTLPADGYHLTMVGSPAVIAQEIRKEPGFDIFTDFVAIGAMTEFVNVMVVSGTVSANTVAEFVAEARRRPGQMNCASAGISTPGHLACETFKARHGVELVHVPFTSTPQALPALFSGQAHVAFFVAPEVLQHVQSGKLKALAMTRDVRWPPLPATPLASQADVRLNVGGWIGLMAPVGTPPAIVSRLNAVLQNALKSTEVQEAAVRAGGAVLLGGPEKLREVAERERVEVKAAVAAARIEKQ